MTEVTIDPPWRLSPLENIINVFWGEAYLLLDVTMGNQIYQSGPDPGPTVARITVTPKEGKDDKENKFVKEVGKKTVDPPNTDTKDYDSTWFTGFYGSIVFVPVQFNEAGGGFEASVFHGDPFTCGSYLWAEPIGGIVGHDVPVCYQYPHFGFGIQARFDRDGKDLTQANAFASSHRAGVGGQTSDVFCNGALREDWDAYEAAHVDSWRSLWGHEQWWLYTVNTFNTELPILEFTVAGVQDGKFVRDETPRTLQFDDLRQSQCSISLTLYYKQKANITDKDKFEKDKPRESLAGSAGAIFEATIEFPNATKATNTKFQVFLYQNPNEDERKLLPFLIRIRPKTTFVSGEKWRWNKDPKGDDTPHPDEGDTNTGRSSDGAVPNAPT